MLITMCGSSIKILIKSMAFLNFCIVFVWCDRINSLFPIGFPRIRVPVVISPVAPLQLVSGSM